MLNITSHPRPLDDPPSGFARSAGFDFMFLLRVVRRHWPLIGATALVLAVLGLTYALTAQPVFTASASVLIDTRKNQLLSNQQVVGDQVLDASGVESQVEVIKSEGIALTLIRDMKLIGDPEFQGAPGFFTALIGSLLPAGETSDAERERKAVELFAKSLKVKRVGLTYVIQIDYTAFSPDMAAKISNGIAEAYMVSELETRYQATRRASRWLQDRIKELREQASTAEREVQKFRADNNLVDTSRGLLSEQQLGDVNGQLVSARAATAEAKARLDRISEIGAGGIPNATVADALKNDVITRLRAQYLDIAARESDWSMRYGVNHDAAVNLRNQMREIQNSITNEIQRIADAYKSEYEIARAREQSIEQSLSKLIDTAGETGQAQVKLRDLESTAQSYRNLYDSFLQRFMEATQQQTFPVTDARLITVAAPPLKKSAPKGSIIVPISTVAGLMIGFGIAFMRERMDNVFRTTRQVELETGLECLGILPRIDQTLPEPTPQQLLPGVVRQAPISRHSLTAPFSRFTETIRAVKVAADLQSLSRPVKVIATVSSVPNEGKSTVAANLAQLMAQTGNSVLLIDGDMRNPSLTKSLAPHAKFGLVDVLNNQKSVADVIHQDAETGLHFIPAVVSGRLWHTAEMLSSTAMSNLLEAARQKYSYVVIDLPPIVPVVDVRAVAHLIDGFVMVVEWGKTSRDVVAEALATVEPLRDHGLGVVLNKASTAILQRLEGYRGRYYKNYYTEEGNKAA